MKNLQTGYASKDKPWIKYHRKVLLKNFNINQTFAHLLKEANKNNLNAVAVNFMGLSGNEWTYKELFDYSNQLADAYIKYGVKQGDTVLIATIR